MSQDHDRLRARVGKVDLQCLQLGDAPVDLDWERYELKTEPRSVIRPILVLIVLIGAWLASAPEPKSDCLETLLVHDLTASCITPKSILDPAMRGDRQR